MLGRVLRAGILAGLCGGFAGFCVQAITVQPLIIAAEHYEAAGATSHTHTPNAVAAVASVGAGATPWSPAPGKERTAYALIANLAFGVGFGLLLVAAMTAAGPMTGVRSGMIWGMCGFLTFTAAPALGLAPELPGMAAADLGQRQLWWLGTAVATGSALALFAFTRLRLTWALAALVLVLPHVIGAPEPPAGTSAPLPPELVVRFMVAALSAAALFWLALGTAAGWLLSRQKVPRAV
jgi:cobalt transporter subunit CbtA